MMPRKPNVAKKTRLSLKMSAFPRTASGFTIIESLVSALILTICLSAVVMVVRIGTQLQAADNNLRQARGILRSTFEDEFGFRQYGTIPDSTTRVNIIVIDPRDGNILQGHLSKIVGSDSIRSSSGTIMPVKIITLVLNWTETGAGQDTTVRTLTMDKILAEIR
jgi:type II secretory pathway pseudopilin PulG